MIEDLSMAVNLNTNVLQVKSDHVRNTLAQPLDLLTDVASDWVGKAEFAQSGFT